MGETARLKTRTPLPESPCFMVVAGEPSGDRHAAGLVRAVEARIGPGGVSWFGYGGSHLRDTGVDLLAGIGEQAAIGPQAALTHLAHYRKSFVGSWKRFESGNRGRRFWWTFLSSICGWLVG